MHMLIEAVQDYAIFILDPDGRVATWNAGAEKIKGYRADEIIGRHFSTFYPQAAIDARWPDKELELATESGRFEDEGWRLRKDGTRFWANVIITAIRGPDGSLRGFAKVTRDLSERKRHEESLRQSEERMRLLVESVHDYAIFMLDPQGVIQSWNVGAQRIKGYSSEEAIGRHFSMFYPKGEVANDRPGYLLRLAEQNGSAEDEGWRVRQDGSLFWAVVVITAIRMDGRLAGFAKVTRDMSERKRLEELESSSRRMKEFLAVLGHELRNPLAPIRNAVTVMERDPSKSPLLQNCSAIIDRQLTQLTQLVNDLLDVGRITSGKITLNKQVLALSDVIERSVEAVRPLMESRQHRLQIEQPATPVLVDGDLTRLTQIFQNLLHNAAKFTPPGGLIGIEISSDHHTATVCVRDNGRGIQPELLESIFGLFVQERTDDTPGESSLGIGLTLVRTIAQLHGGAASASSPGPGRGSVFTISLPLAAEQREVSTAHTKPAITTGRPQRVLIVDDNRDAGESMAILLQLMGHEVRYAFDGASALATAETFRPQLALLDLAMPKMDGFELCRRLRAMPGLHGLIAVAVTGYGQAHDHDRTRAGGFDGHIVKPVEVNRLTHLLDEIQWRRRYGTGSPAG
jgi:PAS domain S-box-containing protein